MHPIFQRSATWPISSAIVPVQVGSRHCHVASRNLAPMQTNQVSNNHLPLPPPPSLPPSRAGECSLQKRKKLKIKSINLLLETIQVASNLCKLSVLPFFFFLSSSFFLFLCILIPSQRKTTHIHIYTHTHKTMKEGMKEGRKELWRVRWDLR